MITVFADPLFEIEVVPARDAVYVVPRGDLDLATIDAVDRQLAELEQAGFEHVVLDLRELDFMDSSGISLIIRHVEAGPERFAIVPGSGQPAEVLELTGLLHALPRIRR